jgi:hypothetical protein
MRWVAGAAGGLAMAMACQWPAEAAVVAEGTFPSSDGSTPFQFPGGFGVFGSPTVPLGTALTLTLSGGALLTGGEWDANEIYDFCFSGQYCLNNYVNQVATPIVYGATESDFSDFGLGTTPGCMPVPDGQPYSGPDCTVSLGGFEWLRYFNAVSDAPFTATLTDSSVPESVPEPASWWMILIGLGGLGGGLRSRRKQARPITHCDARPRAGAGRDGLNLPGAFTPLGRSRRGGLS